MTLYYASSDSNADSRSQQLSKYLASNITLPNNVGNSKMKLDSAKLNGIFTVDSVGHIGTARFDKTGKTINDSEVTAKVVKFTKHFAQKICIIFN
ncbi:hypothetical protein [Leuconostoc suionicum]|uniref:hypothetical protein n=1 Tax=Leuconostoc suionicum TaxID=1511761 RepID=UPI0032DFCE0E